MIQNHSAMQLTWRNVIALFLALFRTHVPEPISLRKTS